jgi:hypothetical protein
MRSRYSKLLELPLLALSLVLLTGCESGSKTGSPDADISAGPPASIVENTTPPDAHFETTPVVRKPRPRRRVAPRRAPRAPVRPLAHGPTLPIGAFAVDTGPAPSGTLYTDSLTPPPPPPASAKDEPRRRSGKLTRPDFDAIYGALELRRCRDRASARRALTDPSDRVDPCTPLPYGF